MKKVKNRLSIIGIAGVPANYGGFETMTDYLIDFLVAEFEVTVYCSSKNYPEKRKFYKGAALKYLPLSPNGVTSILYDAISLLNSVFRSDVILVLGVGPSFLFPLIKRLSNAKILTNIDGLEWKRAKWNFFAKRFLKNQEKNAAIFSHKLIADNKSIERHVLMAYGKIATLIEYGGDHVYKIELTENVRIDYSVNFISYSFSVCRIEPENNIHIILEAFAKSGRNLIIVGNWDKSEYGICLKNSYKNFDNIRIVNAIYNQNILNQIRSNCTIYIHGHSAGGTNPSLVEAMFLELPIFAWDVNYNRFTTENEAFYFKSSKELMELLQMPAELLLNSSMKLKKIANERYTWGRIAKKYIDLINDFESTGK